MLRSSGSAHRHSCSRDSWRGYLRARERATVVGSPVPGRSGSAATPQGWLISASFAVCGPGSECAVAARENATLAAVRTLSIVSRIAVLARTAAAYAAAIFFNEFLAIARSAATECVHIHVLGYQVVCFRWAVLVGHVVLLMDQPTYSCWQRQVDIKVPGHAATEAGEATSLFYRQSA